MQAASVVGPCTVERTVRMAGADRSLVVPFPRFRINSKGMHKMKNDLLRKQYSEAEPIRRREAELSGQRDLARQTTLVVSSTFVARLDPPCSPRL